MLSSLLQKAGFRPGRALHLTIPKVLMAVALAGGSAPILFAGLAEAAPTSPTDYSCNPLTTGGSGGFRSIAFGDFFVGDTITCADKKFTVQSFDFGGTTGDVEFEWTETPPAGFVNDFFSVDIDFSPVAFGGQVGHFEYKLEISDPNYAYDTIQLDSNVAVGSGGGTPLNTEVKKIVNGATTLTSINGAQVGPIALPYASPIIVRDEWQVGATDTLDNIKDTVTQRNEVPGPLPLMGAGMAFGFSRKLRSRIKASASAKV